MASSEKPQWARLKEAGTLRGFVILIWIYKLFGRFVFSLVLYPVMVYFILFRGSSRRASLEYLRTHQAYFPKRWQHKPGYRDVFSHYLAFGQSILDKLLAWVSNIQEDEFDIVNEPALREFLNEPQGQLIIGSHLGNLEYCRGFVERYKSKTINALVYDTHAANFVEMMQRMNPASRMHVYQVDQLDIPTILTLKQKIDQGEWIFIAGDRVPLSGDTRTVEVNFMGRLARLPVGPYILAKGLQSQVKLMYSYRIGKKVRFEMVPFADRIVLARKERDQVLLAYAQQYASELERQCEQAPLQWFNFYDYWIDKLDESKCTQ